MRLVCKYILCIYQDILPWVANCSVYTQGDKSPNYIENQLLTGETVSINFMGGKNYTGKSLLQQEIHREQH